MSMLNTKTRRLFLGLAASIALAGCFKVGQGLPPDAPAYVKAMPNAGQITTVDVAGLKTVTYPTTASVDDAMAFYRNLAAASQLPEGQAPSTTGSAEGQKSAAFGDPGSANYMVVIARPQPPGTLVVVTYKPPPKAGG